MSAYTKTLSGSGSGSGSLEDMLTRMAEAHSVDQKEDV